MRVHFKLNAFEPFRVDLDGTTYAFSDLKPLAERRRLATNIGELVLKLSNGKFIYLTVVGDESEVSVYGVGSGWYVAETIDEQQANAFVRSCNALHGDDK